jgi:hypothetical protein
MALVICCVFLTDRIRRRMSIRLGIGVASGPSRGGRHVLGDEPGLELLQHVLDRAFSVSSMAFFSRMSDRMRGWPFSTNRYNSSSNLRHNSTGRSSTYPLVPAKMTSTCFSTGREARTGSASAIPSGAGRGSTAAATRGRDPNRTARTPRVRGIEQVDTKASGHLPHRLDLRVAADAADRNADVHGGADIRIEQVGFEEDLAVGDRDHVGRDVRGDVAGLRLDERQGRERSAASPLESLAARSSRRLWR